MSQLTIRAESLSKRFNKEWIFQELTYEFRQGKTYAITGPNGSGKSTVMQILWGQMPPSSGSLSYFQGDERIPDDLIYQKVSIATPYMDLIDEFTLTEQVAFHFKTKPIKPGYSIQQVIETMYLTGAKHKFIANFSSGMKQRVKLGLAFLTDTPVLFLDEPGTNLDQQAMAWYQAHLNMEIPGRLILIASNQPEEYSVDAEVFNVMEFK